MVNENSDSTTVINYYYAFHVAAIYCILLAISYRVVVKRRSPLHTACHF